MISIPSTFIERETFRERTTPVIKKVFVGTPYNFNINSNSNSNIGIRGISGISSSSSTSNNNYGSNKNISSKQKIYFNNEFNEESLLMLEKIRNTIAFVYIRAHSGLPVKNSNNKTLVVDTYKMPDDMNLIKITASQNGESNKSFYEYNDKKETIMDSIRAYKNKNTNLSELPNVASSIQSYLRDLEYKNGVKNLEKRNIISNNKIVINKIIGPFSDKEKTERKIKDYIPVQIVFLDDETNDFTSLDIYEDIKNLYRRIPNLLIRSHPDAIKMEDIINFLYYFFELRNVILLDFSCSSFPEDVEYNNLLVNYLDEKNLHGGKYKSSKNKYRRNKKTKTNKNKKTRKTKKL